MLCPLCRMRKVKRTCPGVGQQICAVCCGSKRLVEISCPDTCVYLTAAQRHPAALVRRRQEQDLTLLLAALGPMSEPQLEMFFILQTAISGFAGKNKGVASLDRPLTPGPPLTDANVAEAAAALATSFESAGKGVLYEPQCAASAAEALRRDLKAFLAQVEAQPDRGTGMKVNATRFEREVAVVLRAIERGAKHESEGSTAGPSDYLALVARILHQRPPAVVPSSPPLIVIP